MPLVCSLAEGLAVYTSNYQVLASTCGYGHYSSRRSAEEETTLYCTSSFNFFNDGSSTRYRIEWCHYIWFLPRCNWIYDTSPYSIITPRADDTNLRCSVYDGRFSHGRIFIQVTQRGKPDTASILMPHKCTLCICLTKSWP